MSFVQVGAVLTTTKTAAALKVPVALKAPVLSITGRGLAPAVVIEKDGGDVTAPVLAKPFPVLPVVGGLSVLALLLLRK